MMYLLIYLAIGIAVSLHMINFYKKDPNKQISKKDLKLAVIGPFIWPVQIVKYILDLKYK